MSDTGNILPKVGSNNLPLPIGRAKLAKPKEGEEEGKLSLADLQDTVQLEGIKDSKVNPPDVSKYVQMLKEMDDIRPDEVNRIQSILSEDGYDMDAINKVIDKLLDSDYV